MPGRRRTARAARREGGCCSSPLTATLRRRAACTEEGGGRWAGDTHAAVEGTAHHGDAQEEEDDEHAPPSREPEPRHLPPSSCSTYHASQVRAGEAGARTAPSAAAKLVAVHLRTHEHDCNCRSIPHLSCGFATEISLGNTQQSFSSHPIPSLRTCSSHHLPSPGHPARILAKRANRRTGGGSRPQIAGPRPCMKARRFLPPASEHP